MSFDTFDAGSALSQNDQVSAEQSVVLPVESKTLLNLFDDVQDKLRESRDEQLIHQALDQLFLALQARKITSTDPAWDDLVARGRQHPLAELIHKDPFTFRAFSKPRGYAGDAVMMDYIYGREELWSPPPAELVGQHVFSFTTSAPASEGVRARRAFVATCIDRVAAERHRPNILAIASGHLREAILSAAVRRRKTGRFVALDADALSLAEVERCYGCYGVETITASFRRLMVNSSGSGEFDLVYSTGLFDYLGQRAGQRLLSAMFKMLRPGGSLVVANFLPGVRDIGYMEMFMDWKLVYRTRRDMIDLTMEIPESEVKEVTLFSEECRNIVFLQLVRN